MTLDNDSFFRNKNTFIRFYFMTSSVRLSKCLDSELRRLESSRMEIDDDDDDESCTQFDS